MAIQTCERSKAERAVNVDAVFRRGIVTPQIDANLLKIKYLTRFTARVKVVPVGGGMRLVSSQEIVNGMTQEGRRALKILLETKRSNATVVRVLRAALENYEPKSRDPRGLFVVR